METAKIAGGIEDEKLNSKSIATNTEILDYLRARRDCRRGICPHHGRAVAVPGSDGIFFEVTTDGPFSTQNHVVEIKSQEFNHPGVMTSNLAKATEFVADIAKDKFDASLLEFYPSRRTSRQISISIANSGNLARLAGEFADGLSALLFAIQTTFLASGCLHPQRGICRNLRLELAKQIYSGRVADGALIAAHKPSYGRFTRLQFSLGHGLHPVFDGLAIGFLWLAIWAAAMRHKLPKMYLAGASCDLEHARLSWNRTEHDPAEVNCDRKWRHLLPHDVLDIYSSALEPLTRDATPWARDYWNAFHEWQASARQNAFDFKKSYRDRIGNEDVVAAAVRLAVFRQRGDEASDTDRLFERELSFPNRFAADLKQVGGINSLMKLYWQGGLRALLQVEFGSLLADARNFVRRAVNEDPGLPRAKRFLKPSESIEAAMAPRGFIRNELLKRGATFYGWEEATLGEERFSFNSPQIWRLERRGSTAPVVIGRAAVKALIAKLPPTSTEAISDQPCIF